VAPYSRSRRIISGIFALYQRELGGGMMQLCHIRHLYFEHP
jgi:hypothetical protein